MTRPVVLATLPELLAIVEAAWPAVVASAELPAGTYCQLEATMVRTWPLELQGRWRAERVHRVFVRERMAGPVFYTAAEKRGLDGIFDVLGDAYLEVDRIGGWVRGWAAVERDDTLVRLVDLAEDDPARGEWSARRLAERCARAQERPGPGGKNLDALYAARARRAG